MGGVASARILPFPSVVFSDVEVEGTPGAAPLMTAKSFRMDAELAPYMSGEIRIFSMRVEDPVLRLSMGTDGRLSFVPRGGALPTRAAVVLEDVTIANGTVLVDDRQSGATFALREIAGTFAAQSLAGPVAGGGTLDAQGRRIAFQVSSGRGDAGKGLPLKLTVDDRTLGVSATVDGLSTIADGAPRFDGTIRAANLAEPAKPSSDDAAAAPAEPAKPDRLLPVFTAAGKLAAGPKRIDVADLRLSVGGGEKPYVLNGSGSLDGGDTPTFALTLDGEQVDIDALATGEGPKRAVTFEERLEAARRVLAGIPKPAMPGSATLNLPVVVAGDTTIRDLTVAASPAADGGGWAVRRFGAELPGRTRLEAAGTIDLSTPPGFRGSLLLAARQPSGFSEWLTGAVDPAIRTLGEAGFSAEVDLSPERQSFRDLEVDIGGDALSGSLERTGPRGARTIAAELSGGRLDLDAFVALSRLFTGEADSLADARHGSLAVKAGPVVYGGTEADRVDARLSYDGRSLTIDHADLAGLAGSDITAKGTLADLDRDVSGSVEVTLASRQPQTLIALVSRYLPPSPALEVLRDRASTLGPLDLSGILHTTPGAPGDRPTLDVQISGKADRTALSLSMLLGNGIYAGGSAGQFGLNLSMKSDEAGALLGQIGVEALPLPMPSPLSLDVAVSAGATGPVAASAALRAPGSELAADGTLDVATSGLKSAQFALSGRSENLAPWLLATGNAFGAAPTEALPASLTGTLGYDGAKLALSDAEGSFGASDFSASLEKAGAGPVTGAVFLSEFSAPWLASLVYGHPPADPERPSDWSKASFGATLQTLPPFAVDVTADQIDLGGSAAAGQVSVRVEGRPGEIAFTDLRGVIGGGYGAGSIRLRNEGGVGAFSATGDFQGLDLGGLALSGFALPSEDDPATDAAAPPAVTGTLDAKLRLEASGQSYAGLLSAMTGAGSLHVEDGAFRGIRPGLFADMLAAAQARDFDTSSGNVSGIVARITGDDTYPVPSASADFSVAGGVARFADVRVDRPGERLSADAALDLSRSRVAGSIRLDLDPGDEAVEGAVPAIDYLLSGPLSAPILTPDVQLLANFLSVRALEREQARVEAIQTALQEKLRLRREVRLYRWREDRRLDAEATSATVERIRLDLQRRREAEKAEAARRDEERKAQAEQGERERAAAARARAAEDARRAELAARAGIVAERARQDARERAAARPPEPDPPAPEPRLDLETPPIIPAPPAASSNSSALPGVRDPFEF